MAEPTPAEDTPVPPDETESGRAKHVAPIDEDQPDHPAVARAATGPDAAPPAAPAASTDEPAEAPAADAPAADAPAVAAPAAAAPAAAATPVARSEEPVTADAETRDEPVVAPADEDRTAVLPERQDETVSGTDTRAADATTTDPDRTAVLAAGAAAVDRTPPPPPAPEQRTAPVPPADAPPPPRKGGNRLVGTAWVLLAALVFEVLYLAAFALVVLVVAGSASVALSMQQLLSTPFAWLPVLLFALFYEQLTVLLLNRAGRFAYVLSSLIVALIVYLLSTVLILAMQSGGLSNESNLGRALIAPQVVLIPIIAREVMLWTGLAIGARGRRLRKRNRAAQEQYERERFARSVQDDGAGTPA